MNSEFNQTGENKKPAITCLALDIGGVFHADVWETVVAHYPIELEDWQKIGNEIWDAHAHAESSSDAYWSAWEEKVGHALDRNKIEQIINEKCWVDTSVAAIVDRCLKNGIDVCFVSNNTTFFYEQQMRVSGLGPYLHQITPYLSQEMGVPKIHPERGGLVKLASERDPRTILFVDDRMSSIFKATELGMRTLHYLRDSQVTLAAALEAKLFGSKSNSAQPAPNYPEQNII